MAMRFFGKNPRRKYVRRTPNRNISQTVDAAIEKKEEKPIINEVLTNEIQENNDLKDNTDMADERLEKIEKITGTKAPKRRVKVEKKDKGLIERTENSTILITEDNKMLLND